MRYPRNAPTPYRDYISFGGGLDLVTPAFSTRPGTCRDAQNWEIGINEGYQTIKGYERFDGQPKPSAASFAVMDVTISGSLSVNDTIVGATSAATAVIVAVVTSTTPNYVVITKISGTFQNAENLEVSATVEAVTASTATIDGASSILLKAQYNNLAADEYRGDITVVPGSGSVLGLAYLNDVVYAFRNNAGGTATDLYKSSSSGWVQVALGRELSFTSGGTTEIAVGNTITGAISAATAVITGVTVESGSWAGGDAAGRFIFASQTGTFQAENINVGASLNLATIAGDSTAITLLPDGRFETIVHNFGGLAGANKIYGADGVNRGFEFDGTTFIPIATGMATDTPKHVIAHKNHLFFSFGGSIQHSGISDPYNFTIVLGASELALGDTVTGFFPQPGSENSGSLAIFSRNSTHVLYGTSSSDWALEKYRDEIGAYDYTIQQVGNRTMFLDDRGVADLNTTQAFGNFKHSTISTSIQPWINERKTKVIASHISRDKQQYRLFFSDTSALYITMSGNRILGMMPQLLSHTVNCTISTEANDGSEVIFFGATNGMVYEMEKGTSFDGDNIETYLVLHYHYSRLPRIKKKYMGVTIEASGGGYSTFDFTYELGYTSTDIAQPGVTTETLNFNTINWDDGSFWDSAFWDGVSLTPSNLKMRGSAENVSLVIRSTSDYYDVIKLSGALLRMTTRRELR